jgi:hypothetical protein
MVTVSSAQVISLGRPAIVIVVMTGRRDGTASGARR